MSLAVAWADISIDSFPATDFGVIEGKVTKVSSDALPPDQIEQREQLSFPVTIALDSQQLKLRSGEMLNLQVGMSLTANIKLRKVSYLQLLLGGFQDRAESLPAHLSGSIDATSVCSPELPWPISPHHSASGADWRPSTGGPWDQPLDRDRPLPDDLQHFRYRPEREIPLAFIR